LEVNQILEVYGMKKIALVSTGGTIAMKTDETGLAKPSLTGDDLLSKIPAFKETVTVETFSFKNVPSAHITLEDLISLKSLVGDLKKRGFDGVVITHGTDTLEETAYFLDLTVGSDIAVVLTGAQRNPSMISSDGPLNLMDSLLVAADDVSKDMGVLVVFSSEIVAAREAMKFHRTRVDTFKSLEFGPLGVVNNNKVIWYRKPIIKDTYNINRLVKEVDIVSCYLGADFSIIYSSIDKGAKGIVIQALGAGHIPFAMLDGIKEAIKRKIPVVMTSRVPLGRLLTDTYGFEGGERYLKDIGVIFGEDLSAQKARIKLIVLLSAGLSNEDIKKEFEKHFYM